MLSAKRELFEPLKAIVAKPFMRMHPNVLTIGGLLFSVLFFILFVQGYYLLALLSFFAVGLDSVDGTVARATGRTSKFGAFLDSSLDRVADFLYVSAFGFAGVVSWNIIVPLIFSSVFISYLRARAEASNEGKSALAVGVIERSERLVGVLLGVIAITFFPTTTLGGYSLVTGVCFLLLAFSFITIYQRIIEAQKVLR